MLQLKKGDVIQIIGRMRKTVREYEEDIPIDDLDQLAFIGGPLEQVWVTWEPESFDEPLPAIYLGTLIRDSGYIGNQNPVNAEERITVCMVCAVDNRKKYHRPFEVIESQIIIGDQHYERR